MREVYAGVEEVMIWLRLPDDHTEFAMSHLRDKGSLDRDGRQYFKTFWFWLQTHPGGPDEGADESWRRARQQAMDSIFSRPWWRCVWTVQEYFASRRTVFMCGKFSLEGDVVEAALNKLADRSKVHVRSIFEDSGLHKAMHKASQQLGLDYTLHRSQ
ncbi:hypothetical protein K458DRAFT_394797 [Lentithecium fluviatile CBS 122367]|uniref:Heterokaryon incompatibility domain-containing protein n=1 Tax=Lentithecium fluviatile CBS 122367 TaxID=1168545 RepID=A0A6G1IKK7_9PLEO|nr:hypothetical protein K458DRAFT_394797 [Lentithecium fluviatile CBS 122367]